VERMEMFLELAMMCFDDEDIVACVRMAQVKEVVT
jgi:hypothetical protein